jgi:phthalate 4,5-dioxygenase reductase subunit
MSASAEPTFTSLRVRRAEAAAEGIQLFELACDDGAALPAFTPGAHLHVKAPNGLIRRYSLANDPDETSFYQFAVKREAEGTGGSRSIVDDVQLGDLLEVSAPRNDFALVGNPPSYVFIAGGIGITPILSMARHLLATGGKPFRLYYLGRSPELMAFRDDLSAPEFRGRVVMHCDQGDPTQAYDLWPVLEKPKGAHVYCCGPRGLMEAVRDMTGHWPTSAVHFEDFGTRKAASADDVAFTIRLAKTGAVHLVPPGQSVLEVLRAAGIAIASSCESGSCGTCIVDVVSGAPEHRDLVLAEHEKGRKFISCVSRAAGELVLDL